MKTICNSLPPKSGKSIDMYTREINDLMLEIYTLEDRLKVVEENRNELWCENVDLKSTIDKVSEYCTLNKEFTPRLIDILEILEDSE